MNAVRLIPALSAAALLACGAPGESGVALDGELNAAEKIYYGDAADSPHHYATVSLHTAVGGRVLKSPFCTGTLIAEDVVLTAGHCVESWGGSVLSPSQVAIYVGENPFSDLSSHTYTVSEIEQHADYNSMALTDDIALIRLDSAVTEATPVPHLPSSLGLGSSDVGGTLNFAGFGSTESGGYGKLLQVDQQLDAVYSETIYYTQASGGPCSGDSGGPAYYEVGGTWYVAGVTSYGDWACKTYGVSTKVDAYTTWIDAFVGSSSTGGGGTTTTGCSGFDDTYAGTLTGSGDYAIEPDGNYYFASSSGTHDAALSGDSGTDFDLYLYRYIAGGWRAIRSSEDSGTSDESISFSGARGYYMWVVASYDGSGDYELCLTTP